MDESDSPPPTVWKVMGVLAGVPEPVSVPVPARKLAGEQLWAGYVRRIAAGAPEALTALYDDTNRIVYSAALRILGNPADAEEVALDVYTQIWRTAATFDGRRGSVLSWLLTITRSRAIDLRRWAASRSRNEEPLGDDRGLQIGHATLPSFSLGLTPKLYSALDSLSGEQRQAIEMAYLKGFSHTELAERFGVPLGTIKTRIRLGMIKLREALGERSDA